MFHFLECQSHFLPTLSSLKAWTSGFAKPFSSSYSLQFLLIMLSALPWTSTFYLRPVLTLHINSLPPLLKQMSHYPVPHYPVRSLSEHIESVLATGQRCRDLSWTPTALQLHSLTQCLWYTTGEGWDGTPTVSPTCHGHPADIPSQARHCNGTLHISFVSCSHNLLPFIPQSRNTCEAKTQEIRAK